MQCPKCGAPMQTFNRNGVQIEQCGGCRGIFLDYGELESLTRLESQWQQPPGPPPAAPYGQQGHAPPQAYPAAPAWGAQHHGKHGHHGHHKHGHKRGFGHMLFSS
ncbi:zf-TFIIB domain containing protein [Streptomyces abyssalis]|uniref:Zf-TFIIB domain containing protein n=1 Tax=Streptomyces abyssalis TaxID=933944 RepID=A0A1E7JUH6_9ACTN|nr:zf-TFIIB domain-containing protein [Streptomyces abyssalis]OEU88777.1 zf-TFIIB domain containing protein [Streptomyces abyssalis]OEU93564.1 zf-TFIIB domain containing protein [Streptomyces abyssalis]